MNVKTILVPLDGSRLAEMALQPSVDMARVKGAKIVLLRAAEAFTTITDPADAQMAAVQEAEAYLAFVRARLLEDRSDVGVETAVWYGPPADAITNAARYRNADLIVMSSHGRSGLGRLVLGSVAERVLRATRTPILLIRHGNAPIEAPSRPSATERASAV